MNKAGVTYKRSVSIHYPDSWQSVYAELSVRISFGVVELLSQTVVKEATFLVGNPTAAEQEACRQDRPVFLYLQLAELHFKYGPSERVNTNRKADLTNEIVAGNKDHRWLWNTTTMRPASLQPIREYWRQGKTRCIRPWPEAGGSNFIRKFLANSCQTTRLILPEDNRGFSVRRTNRNSNISRENFIDFFIWNKQRLIRVSVLSSTSGN